MTSTNKRDGGDAVSEAVRILNEAGYHDAADNLAESRAECERLQEQADWCSDALRIEIGQFVGANATLEALTIRACNDLARYKARAERLAGAGKRVTAAFRALGCKLGFTELVEARHECEAAILALDAALEQEPQE